MSNNQTNTIVIDSNKQPNNSQNQPPADSKDQPPADSKNQPPADPNKQPPADDSSVKHFFDTIFSQSTLVLVLWFLAIYFIAYFLIGFFVKSDSSSSSSIYNFLDVVIFGSIIGYLIFYYYNMPQPDKDNSSKNIINSANTYLHDPTTFVHAFLFLVVFNIVLYLFRIPTTGADKPYFVGFFMGLAWIIFTISIIIWFFNTFLGVDLLGGNFLSKFFDNNAGEPQDEPDEQTQQVGDQVFNISNNLYTYDDAKAVCTAFGARLATYNEIEDAYNKGGEWCNYGWSDSQMAFFPTQKSTWDELQKNPKHKNDCGRPGVNGGYMANPYIKFGVNCYGQKPQPTDRDLQEMDANKNVIFPKTDEEQLLDKKVEFWKENAEKLLNVNSFNKQKWSEY